MGSSGASASQPLKVLVVGAGIAGLTAATGLRRQGHHVEVFERSSLLKEYGAAISIGPNASAVLRRLGVFLENYGGTPLNGVRLFKDEALVKSEDRTGYYDSHYKHPYHTILRQDLHRALREAATAHEGLGQPATIITSAKVAKVDTVAASITLEDGRNITGDVVIGADGVHSISRNNINGAEDFKEHPYGRGVYRCLIPIATLMEDPVTRPFVEKRGYMTIWMHADPPIALIMYPCESGKTLNIAAESKLEAFSPEELAMRGNIDVSLIKERLHGEYDRYSTAIKELINKIDSVGIWSFADMDKIPRIVTDSFAVIGDAAHPFLPFLGQGGAMAMEDAASIASLLPLGTSSADVPSRLKLYDKARYDRAHSVQEKTRISGSSAEGFKDHPIVGNAGGDFAQWLYSYDAWQESEKLLVSATQ